MGYTKKISGVYSFTKQVGYVMSTSSTEASNCDSFSVSYSTLTVSNPDSSIDSLTISYSDKS